MLSIQNLTKSYGTRVLFEDASFTVGDGERLGIVGRNGYGKTTLFRLILGEEEPDAGAVSIPKNYSFACLKQHIDFTKSTVIDEAASVLPPEREHDAWQVEKILSGLGFSDDDLLRHPSEFSGGFQMRIELAKVLALEPHLLLLDEPTNFLDISSIRWLESFLKKWPHELLLVSHDRSFMDSVCTHVAGIHRKKIRKYKGTTSQYYAQIEQEEEVYEKERLNDERKRKHMEEFVERFRAKANKASQAQSRVKALEKMEVKDALSSVASLSFSFREAEFPTKNMLEARDISFSYSEDGSLIISGCNAEVLKGDRIGVIGKNGKGKTTLMRLFVNALKPKHGDIRLHPRLKIGYFEQANTASLVPERTIEEEILSANADLSIEGARSIGGAMMFSGDDALKKISVLSGGEQCRVLLARILAENVNFLVLDEPTHHLDMYSCDALVSALKRFNGASCVVTHDEHFLRGFATKLIVFQSDGIRIFPGTYDEFLEQVGWEDEETSVSESEKSASDSKVSRKIEKQRKAELIVERSRALKPVQKRIDELEVLIEESENRRDSINDELVAASESQNAELITALSSELADVSTSVEKYYEELDRKYSEFDEISTKFAV